MRASARRVCTALVFTTCLVVAVVAAQARRVVSLHEKGTGCVVVFVRDSARTPVRDANVTVDSLRLGDIADSLGRAEICRIPEGKVLVTVRTAPFLPEQMIVKIDHDRPDTLRFTLRLRPLNVGETLSVAPRHVDVGGRHKPSLRP